MINVTAIG